MHKITLTVATFVMAFSGIAYAESPNLELQALRRQQQARASQDRPSEFSTFGFSNPDRMAPADFSTKDVRQPVGVSPEAIELRRTLFGR